MELFYKGNIQHLSFSLNLNLEQTHRQKEEDQREILQLEPILERVFRLPNRRNGYEASLLRCYGNLVFIIIQI